MTPYEQSIAEATQFIIDKLGRGPEVRELLFYIQKLETENKQLKQRISDLSWEVNAVATGYY